MTCESTFSSGEGSTMNKSTWQRREAEKFSIRMTLILQRQLLDILTSLVCEVQQPNCLIPKAEAVSAATSIGKGYSS